MARAMQPAGAAEVLLKARGKQLEANSESSEIHLSTTLGLILAACDRPRVCRDEVADPGPKLYFSQVRSSSRLDRQGPFPVHQS